eukprot:TRINITY_DN5699_c0_g1_i1.p1 TRINITY_DN5699_c0_g1~~TRINITY_DN5699_c0_g1_i1.p1  ORF type:complete len:418 (+),score=66.87 TRINITY_DN5699_c0_g1_i1:103-1356(+)
MTRAIGSIVAIICSATIWPVESKANYKVGAIYFGDWHVDPHMEAYHTLNWTEYDLVINAQPRFPGHIQPNIPLWLNSSAENTPAGAQQRINAATSAGIDFFMFDWYWYKELNTTNNGAPFLDGALNDGFLRAPNNSMEFALMFANQDWVDLHPAKPGWHGSYRSSPTDTRMRQLLMYDGFMDNTTYTAALRYVVDKYMTKPNYLKVETLQNNGSIANCSFFSFYQAEYIVVGTGGVQAAKQVLDDFRAYASNQGVGCLHISFMEPNLKVPLSDFAIDSVSHYGWMKTVGKTSFPYAAYADVLKQAVSLWSEYTHQFGVPYIPSLSVAWDPSPRCIAQEAFVDIGYPWGSTWRSTPQEFEQSLNMGRAYLDQRCGENRVDICPPMLINAWNEWSEGAYLEPDVREGDARLQAVKSVFG